METQWFYLEEGRRHGPVGFEELVNALLLAPSPHAVPVWREGMAEWMQAGYVPELSQRLPPAYPVPESQAGGWPAPLEDAEAIARLYRRLVLLVGAQLVVGCFFRVPSTEAELSQGTALLALLLTPVVIGLGIAMVVTTYKLARHLGSDLAVLWAVAMFIPCINILVLLALSAKAQSWCRRYGIKVGLFGPTQESIEEIRRRGVTSTFE
jgi:hypothetical protein